MANAVTKPAPRKSVAKREPSIFEKGLAYVRESWAETKRATWPSWMDIRRLTIAVLSGVAAVTLYIYVLDMCLAFVSRTLLGAK